jgi:hypothetical protein
MRRSLLAGGLVVTLSMAACGASSTGDAVSTTVGVATTAAGADLTGFGAVSASWDANHRSDAGRYSAVTSMGGRIISYDISFPQGTTLPAAEQFVREQLPPDTKETATFSAKAASGSQSCMLLNYQSPTLANLLGSGPFDDPLGAVGAYLETRSASAPQAPLARNDVTFAGLMLGWNRGGDGC